MFIQHIPNFIDTNQKLASSASTLEDVLSISSESEAQAVKNRLTREIKEYLSKEAVEFIRGEA